MSMCVIEIPRFDSNNIIPDITSLTSLVSSNRNGFCNKHNHRIIQYIVTNNTLYNIVLVITNLIEYYLIRSFSFILVVIFFFRSLIKIAEGKDVLPTFFKGERKEQREFLKLKELTRIALLVSELLGLRSKERSLLLSYVNYVTRIWKDSGVIFATKYFSEILRLCLVYLSNERTRDTKVWIVISRKGLPKSIPEDIRLKLIELKHRKIVCESHLQSNTTIVFIRAFFTILSFFRGASGHHKPNYTSITKPFSGVATSVKLDLVKSAIAQLGSNGLIPNNVSRLAKPTFFIPNKAGANSNLVITSIGLDLLAMMNQPQIWFSYIRWCIWYKYHLLLVMFISLSILLLPALLLYKFLYLWSIVDERLNYSGLYNFILRETGLKIKLYTLPPLLLGRLAFVNEAKQKCRVVGITDWWTQILLKPLHDRLSEILKLIPEDGTFSQLKPVEQMFFNPKTLGQITDPIDSIDLSNATDRLPIDFQADILNCLGIHGDLWKALLTRGYFAPDLGYNLIYSVGQPMGVYSSFNMLALSNHVLNHISLNLTETPYVPGTGQYAVLGDDDAGKVQTAASKYRELLAYLGVEANPIKGFSGNILEFAKRIFFNNQGQIIELSPLGMKALVNAMRNPFYLVTIYLDMNKKSFIYDEMLNRLFSVLGKFFNKEGLSLYLYTFCILGPQGGLWPNPSLANPNVTPLNLKGVNFSLVMDAFQDLLVNHMGITFKQVTSVYTEHLERMSIDLSSITDEFTKIIKELQLLVFCFPKSKTYFNSMTRLSKYTLVIYSSLLAIFISLPFIIKITFKRYAAFLKLDIDKFQAKQEGFNGFFKQEWKFTERVEPGENDILFNMWYLDFTIPFNVIVNKLTLPDLVDQSSAMKMAKVCCKLNPDLLIKLRDHSKKMKFERLHKKLRNRSAKSKKKGS